MAKKKTVAKKKAAKKASASGSKRGTRYSATQKANVIAYVNQINAEKGRGGAAAASRKFGVGQLTIGKWMKEPGGAKPVARRGRPPGSTTGRRGRPPGRRASSSASSYRQLADMDELIGQKRHELNQLEADFAKLKKTLLR